ncbi:hypothetical protein [Spirosoma litoris]
MNAVISEGDRVSVTRFVQGFERGKYKATVLGWVKSGRLKVKADGTGAVTHVRSDHVKKLADKPQTLEDNQQ